MKIVLKPMVNLFVLLLSIGLVACEDTHEANQNETVSVTETEAERMVDDAEISEPQELNETSSEANIEESWQQFIAAVEANNKEGVKEFCDKSISDMVSILFLLREDYVLSEMKKTDFLDLPMKELDGEKYRQVYGEFIEFEEGIEYGSSVTLWFDVVDDQILLKSYSAAG
jgi:hypothetical protein